MQITTPRLLLRPMYAEDAAQVHSYSREINVGPAAGWKPHESLEETVNVMREIFLGKDDVFAIVLLNEKRVIGTIGLIPDTRRKNPHARMLGYAMSESCWGRGLMTEAAEAVIKYAFSNSEINVISAYCYPFNIRSQRVLEKCGFTHDGCLRAAELRYDGCILDCECYSLLRGEYNL